MNARHLIIVFAAGLGLQGCVAADDAPDVGPELPRVEQSELTAEAIAGPALSCDATRGTLFCSLAVADGFRVEMATILAQSAHTVDERGFFGDVEVAQLTRGAIEVMPLPQYPVDLDVQIHYTTESIVGPDGTTETEAAVRCLIELTSPSTTEVSCDAGTYERWNVYLVPNAALADAWRAEKFGTASVQTTLVSEVQDSTLCFRNYPRCGDEALAELWDEVPDSSGEIPDAIHYAFTMPRDAATSSVSVTTNVMYNPTPVAGPGIYVVTADGDVLAVSPE